MCLKHGVLWCGRRPGAKPYGWQIGPWGGEMHRVGQGSVGHWQASCTIIAPSASPDRSWARGGSGFSCYLRCFSCVYGFLHSAPHLQHVHRVVHARLFWTQEHVLELQHVFLQSHFFVLSGSSSLPLLWIKSA